jgi:hypothetical protein
MAIADKLMFQVNVAIRGILAHVWHLLSCSSSWPRRVVVSNHPLPQQTSRTTIDTPLMPGAFTQTLSPTSVSCTYQSRESPTCPPVVH